jgi:hypothetical protein
VPAGIDRLPNGKCAMSTSRREFVRRMGLSAASLPFLTNLPSLGFANSGTKKQRLVVVFSPNGVVMKNFWPEKPGTDFDIKPILKPLEPFRDKMLVLHGVGDKIRGDGDNHMRGIGCLLTGIELFPGNIQGGSHTPAGWASGLSIDQELKNYLQKSDATRTRFGSLEFGVMVPNKADTWTRMVYTGPNKPVAPIDDPYQMFNKLYGRTKDRAMLASILDGVEADLKKLGSNVSTDDRRLLDEHANFVREMEKELKADAAAKLDHKVPELEPGVKAENDQIPKITRMQIELMVNSFTADFARLSTLQITNSVGMPKMTWLGIKEGHHTISHEPDSNADAVDKLTKINTWYAEQVAYLAKRLAETPEPGGPGSLLDNTTIVWTNELGQGNSHTLENIPFVLVGGGLGFKTGRSIAYGKKGVPHNRLLMSIAHGFGHHVKTFGNPDFCAAGPLDLA